MTILVTGGAGYIGSHMVLALVDAGEQVVVLDNLSTGFDWAVAQGVPLVVGESGDQALVGRLIAQYRVDAIIHFAASIVVPEFGRDPLGYYRNNTVNSRALIECAVRRRATFHLFLDGRGLRQSGENAGNGRQPDTADVALWLVEADDRDHAARRRRARYGLGHVILRYFNVAGADPQCRTGQSTQNGDASDQGRGGERRLARGRSSMCSAWIIQRQTARASATTFMSAISCARILTRCDTCAPACRP